MVTTYYTAPGIGSRQSMSYPIICDTKLSFAIITPLPHFSEDKGLETNLSDATVDWLWRDEDLFVYIYKIITSLGARN